MQLSDAEKLREQELSLQGDEYYDDSSNQRSPNAPSKTPSDEILPEKQRAASAIPRPSILSFSPAQSELRSQEVREDILSGTSGSTSNTLFFTPSDNVPAQFPTSDDQSRSQVDTKPTQFIRRRHGELRDVESFSPIRKRSIRFTKRAMTDTQDSVDMDSGNEW
ncbi:unnamed protein product [Anisakis simplex]|uniref:Uncharacterized protein n=1 Tax=Anisakis simplex TaxID=6269 RepID=A0A3P6NAD2_ANISI|nr:unnamed protein product [Anisakis simplex]